MRTRLESRPSLSVSRTLGFISAITFSGQVRSGILVSLETAKYPDLEDGECFRDNWGK